jgi:hypothetical protein
LKKRAPLKSLITLLSEIARDCAVWCDTSTELDIKTIQGRVEREGKSFLTITLPAFGKDFERSLDQGHVAPSAFPGFHRRQGLPVFLRGFLELVFDPKSGLLLDNPSTTAIRSIRQITLLCGKMAEPCGSKRTRAAMRQYVECEQDVHQGVEEYVGSALQADFTRVGKLLLAPLLSSVSNRLYAEGILPKHGPGATADRLRGNAKYDGKLWTTRLEQVFPHWENLIPSESVLNWTDDVTLLEPGVEVPVKVTPVPKTAKTPRIIAMEPTHMQYVQQGLLELITECVSGDDYARAFFSSDSQEHNQLLARFGSLHGTLATLDLSEASDRVSNQHVRDLLVNHGILRDAVDACRSRKAELPDGTIISLAKFASMGSALCFPFESMVFTTAVFVGIEYALNRHLTHSDIKSLIGSVRVYGDDIICPVDYVESIVRVLEGLHLRVNTRKSFWTGKFRESCGKDYYDGNDVSVVRLRTNLPKGRQHVQELVSTVSLRNQLFKAGYSRVVDWLDDRIGDIIPFPDIQLPTVGYEDLPNYGKFLDDGRTALLGRHTFSRQVNPDDSWDPHLHRPLIRGATVRSTIPESPLDGVGALMKWFLNSVRGLPPIEDEDHLARAGRANAVRIKVSRHAGS